MALSLYGFAAGGPGAVQFGGLDMSGLQGVQSGIGQFGTAQGGPAAPSVQGLNLAGVGGAQMGVGANQFGTAQGGPAGLNLGGFDAAQVGQIANAPAMGEYGMAGRGPAAGQIDQNLNLSGVGDVARKVQIQTVLTAAVFAQYIFDLVQD